MANQNLNKHRTINIERIESFKAHTAAIFCLERYKTDKQFLSAGGDGLVLAWQLDKPDETKAIAQVANKIFSLRYDSETALLLVGTLKGELYVFDTSEKVVLKAEHKLAKSIFAFQKFQDSILICCGDGNLYRFFPEKNEIELCLNLTNTSLRSIVPVDKNEWIIGASDAHFYHVIFENETFSLKDKKRTHENSVFTLLFQNSTLYSGGRDALLNVTALTGFAKKMKERFAVPAHLSTINKLVFHQDLELIISASRDKTIKLWTKHLELLKVIDILKFDTHLFSVNTLLSIPKTSFFLSAGDDRQIILWEISLGLSKEE